MAEGIRDKVAIIGMGCTKFGELWGKSGSDLIVDAAKECFEDAKVEPKDIQALWYGTCMSGMTGLPLSTDLKQQYKAVTHVENACATGSEALRNAAYGVASGAYDMVMAVGMEKLKDTGYGGLPAMGGGFGPPTGTGPNATAPGMFALMATRYFAHYGINPDDGKKLLAHIAVKSHHNGSMNPKAHLRKETNMDQVLNAPIIAWPLGLFDCCGVSDGSACAILVPASQAKNFRPDPIYIKALQIAVGAIGIMDPEYDFTHVESTYQAGLKAYEEAGVKNPREEISMAEVHDCFSITELATYEDMQWSKRGGAKEDIESGFYDLDGGLPVQPDGGLKCFGHPIGATGLRMMYEMYKQLQGKADLPSRQIKDPKLGLTHNLGGFPAACVCSCFIAGL
ncbi:MAG: acetyl-CoA acetyltransferase [Chloroflexota bacterium]|nr:acetyl-CoA acetyltransferase [Chloroflexota bacterium]